MEPELARKRMKTNILAAAQILNAAAFTGQPESTVLDEAVRLSHGALICLEAATLVMSSSNGLYAAGHDAQSPNPK